MGKMATPAGADATSIDFSICETNLSFSQLSYHHNAVGSNEELSSEPSKRLNHAWYMPQIHDIFSQRFSCEVAVLKKKPCTVKNCV